MSDQPFRAPPGAIAVIFVSSRRAERADDGYAEAALAMSRLAAAQPGWLGETHARGEDGTGITVSWWADEESADAWRNHPDHGTIRGRARGAGGDPWYDGYALMVAEVRRSYAWRAA